MSKYIDDLQEQLKGKDIMSFTKELQASRNLSKILKNQQEKKRMAKVKADIQKLLAR